MDERKSHLGKNNDINTSVAPVKGKIMWNI